MRRRGVLIGVTAAMAGAALAGAPALGADGAIEATVANTFTPATVTVNVGEKVTFHNAGGFHNVDFDDGALKSPASPSLASWTAQRTFDKPGSFRFYCDAHGGPGGAGMSGTIVVVDPNMPPPPPPPPPPPVATPMFTAGPVQGHFCAKRSKTCKKPGVRIRFTSSERVVGVRGVVQRRALRNPRGGAFRAFGTVKVTVEDGTKTVALGRTTSGKALGVGDYRITFQALGFKRIVRFSVRA